MNKSVDKKTSLTVGFPGAWGALVPAQQHTMFGDAILGNEFEPLVDMERGGVITPYAAKYWSVSDDMRVYTFTIDSQRRFSDGSALTAHDFKRSWEYGLKLDSNAAQKSLMDVAYKIEGFEQFNETGHLKGVEVLDDATLRVTFSSPFRMALDHLTGSRFAAFKIVDGRYIGTGPYRITRDTDNEIEMEKNPFSNQRIGFPKIKILSLTSGDTEKALLAGKIDVYAYAGRSTYDGPCNDESTSCLDGFESAHRLMLINGMKSRIFEDRSLRLALQFIMTQTYNGVDPGAIFKRHMVTDDGVDPQSFLELQAGRLPTIDALRLINDGEKYVKKLVDVSSEKGIIIAYGKGTRLASAAIEIFGAHGVKIQKHLPVDNYIQLQELMDKQSIPDIAFASKSVVDGDPDGLYHALGEHGAIVTPMTLRPKVSQLLEEGRNIQDVSKLDVHYKKVAVAILEEVPWVHIDFLREKTVYRSDLLTVNFRKIKSRIREPFSIFEPK